MSKLGLEYDPPPREPSTALVEVKEIKPPPTLVHEWPVGLSSEIALNDLSVGVSVIEEETLCRQFGLTQDELDGIKAHPAFRAEVRECLTQIKESNATIKRKAKIAFEHYMDVMIPALMNDPKVNPDVKVKAWIHIGKVMGLEVDEANKIAENGKGNNSGPSINIILTTVASLVQAPSITIDGERVIDVQP